MLNNKIYVIPGAGETVYPNASQVTYDNTSSGIHATNVQDALDDVVSFQDMEEENTLYVDSFGTIINDEGYSIINKFNSIGSMLGDPRW
jgi:hypothetical protein